MACHTKPLSKHVDWVPTLRSCCLSDTCCLFDCIWLLICVLGHVVQIRVHLAHAGYAIIGDDVYGLQVISLTLGACAYQFGHYSVAKSAGVSAQHSEVCTAICKK